MAIQGYSRISAFKFPEYCGCVTFLPLIVWVYHHSDF